MRAEEPFFEDSIVLNAQQVFDFISSQESTDMDKFMAEAQDIICSCGKCVKPVIKDPIELWNKTDIKGMILDRDCALRLLKEGKRFS